MAIEFTEDQVQFREVVQRFLQDKNPPTVVRTVMETNTGFDAAVWQQLSHELGLTGIHVPERFGGAGFGPVELAIICEEMGRHLYAGPFFSSAVMATCALLTANNEATNESLLPQLARGEQRATLVLDNLNSPTSVGQQIRFTNGHLSGSAPIVLDANTADVLLVIAGNGDQRCLLQTKPSAAGISIAAVESLDPTRQLARIEFNNTPAEPIADLSTTQIEQLWNELCVYLAHEMIGGAEQLFYSTIEYTKVRVQFGRPIGSFQGLKHRCADLLMEIEFAKAATQAAAFDLASSDGASAYKANMAKAMAADACMEAARTAVQLRGGIGFTWEEDTHLWFKRAKSNEVLLGTPHLHRERMMQHLETQHRTGAVA